MEIIRFLDGFITIGIVGALIWFITSPIDREKSALLVAILYTVGAPFDIIDGRNFTFWVSLACSGLYLRIHVGYKKRRLAGKPPPDRLFD